ncbi:hypothetical protein AB0K74_16390 [Streptomyces sp. NPDC056159]|uniref:hypothetical protein n=1 Tax=Streptomyces sp. NPDC056159 TaxID=3155537 RepID=UPI003423A06A
MATIPATQNFLAGERVTAAKLNRATRDPIDFLMNPPRAKITSAATQSVALTNEPYATFDTELYDNDGMWNPAAPTLLTIKTPGYYSVVGTFGFANNATGYRRLSIYVNGTLIASNMSPAIAANMYMSCSQVAYFRANDTASMRLVQNSGAALNAVVSAHTPTLTVQWLGL